MANKKTNREWFNDVIAMAKEQDRLDMVEWAEGRIEALDKKSANKKPTKTQEENEVLKAEIMAVLTDEKQSISEIQSKSEKLTGLSTSKMSALLRLLKNDGKVDRVVDKKKAYFVAV